MANNPEITMLLDIYGDILTKKQRDMIDYYYNDDLSLSEIAENEGITRQGVRDSIKRAEIQMYEMEKKLGLNKKFSAIRQGLDTISRCTAEITRVNGATGLSPEISRNCRVINETIDNLKD